MDPSSRGSLRLFQVAGINVYLHWSWFLVAFLQITNRTDVYQLGGWKVVEYASLFAIVLLHEFGHALACRSVGGSADHIVLWPLGGVAYVSPPPRPGAFLWSIVAGPLVNFLLVIPTCTLWFLAYTREWDPDVVEFVKTISLANIVMLVFNLLPVYPLDGGQILQSLLWFIVDRWHSLLIVSVIGLVLGGSGFILSAMLFLSFSAAGNVLATGWGMLALISAFVGLRSLIALQQSRGMILLQNLPRHLDSRCPSCGTSPPAGAFWVCEHCQNRFDLFSHRGKCPSCGAWYLHPDCPHCRETNHIDRWFSTTQPSETQSSRAGLPPRP